jgi:D-tyrosyl-tRNA(Tyr) deacylase
MRALLQRVSEAKVTVDGITIGQIGPGLLVFIGIHENDDVAQAEKLARKILRLRIFPDEEGKMNLSVADTAGELLIVSQFTLYGETAKGNRPSYSQAASPKKASTLYEMLVSLCRQSGLKVATGKFQAHMKVHLVNDGPVTLLCEAGS